MCGSAPEWVWLFFRTGVAKRADKCGSVTGIYILNKVFATKEYEKFAAVAEAMGVSKSALAIRMKQLHLLGRDDLKDPYALVRVVCDDE